MHVHNSMSVEVARCKAKAAGAEAKLRKVYRRARSDLSDRLTLSTALVFSHLRFNIATWTAMNARQRSKFSARYHSVARLVAGHSLILAKRQSNELALADAAVVAPQEFFAERLSFGWKVVANRS